MGLFHEVVKPDLLWPRATELAGQLGDIRVANTVMLGALISRTHLIKRETFIERTLPDLLTGKKASLIDINRKAFLTGLNGRV